METESSYVLNEPEFKRFKASLSRFPDTTDEEEERLCARLKLGGLDREQAAQRLVESHLRLVLGVAVEFRGRGVSLGDLIQEGTVGLYDATRRFDSKKGTFRTYAYKWIWQRLKEYVNKNARCVPLPINVVRRGVKIAKQRDSGGRLTDQEMAEMLGTDAANVRLIETATQSELSLDAPVKDDVGATFGESIEARSFFEDIETDMHTRVLVKAVQQALSTLDDREIDVLKGRFAMRGDDDPVERLEELAAKHGVSREWIRQIQNTAMKKLKKGPFAHQLRRYLD